jgi:hypothetical protein
MPCRSGCLRELARRRYTAFEAPVAAPALRRASCGVEGRSGSGRRAPGLAIGVGEARRITDQPAGGGNLAAVVRNWGGALLYMVASARIEGGGPANLL